MIGGEVGFGDLSRVRLAGFRQGDNLQIDVRSEAMRTARLTALVGLGAIDGRTVLLGRFGRQGPVMDGTLQAITDSELLARFAPCVDFRRLSLKARSTIDGDGRTATMNFSFADGFSLDVAASFTDTGRRARLSTSPFALAPCGAVAPEYGLDLRGQLALELDLDQSADETRLSWSSDLEDVSLQFHELFQAPLAVERFRGKLTGTAEAGLQGRGELALADLPVYLDAATAGQQQSLGVTTATPLPLLRLARLLSFKGLEREQRNAVLRQVRRGRIERLWLGSSCAVGAIGDCLASLGRWETDLDGRIRVADLVLTPLPRAPGLSISALEGKLTDGGFAVAIEDGPISGFRLTGGTVELSQREETGFAAKGDVAFAGPVGDFAALAREALGTDASAKFEVRAGEVGGSANVDWPQTQTSDDPWLSMNLRMAGLQGRAAAAVEVEDATLRASARVSGPAEAPSVAARLHSLEARGVGWSISGSGRGDYRPDASKFAVDAEAILRPEVLAIALPEPGDLRWTSGPLTLTMVGEGQSSGEAGFDLRLDGGKACLALAGAIPVRIKDCGESLTAAARLELDVNADRYGLSGIKVMLASEPMIADGRVELQAEGPNGYVETGRLAADFLTSRLPDGRVVAGGGHLSARLELGPDAWMATADLHSLQLVEPVVTSIDGRIESSADIARADLVLRPDLSAMPEVRLSATVTDIGPAPAIEGAIRIPSIEIPRFEASTAPAEAAADRAPDDPAPILLPELDRFIVGAPDTFIPGRGNISLRVDSVNLAAGGAAAGHVDGAFAWSGQGQRLTMDWLRDNRVSAALFAEVQQVAARASALARLRFATSDVDTALISRLLVGRPIAEAGALGMQLDLQGPWQRSLRRWSGFLELRGNDIDLTEAQLLAETIAASGAETGSIPGILGLRRASVQARLADGSIRFQPVYLETNVATVFGQLGLSLDDNGVSGLAVVGPLKDLQDLFQLLPGLHSVGDAVEALRFAVKIDGTVQEPEFERVGAGGTRSEPEVVRTLQDTLRKLQALGGN